MKRQSPTAPRIRDRRGEAGEGDADGDDGDADDGADRRGGAMFGSSSTVSLVVRVTGWSFAGGSGSGSGALGWAPRRRGAGARGGGDARRGAWRPRRPGPPAFVDAAAHSPYQRSKCSTEGVELVHVAMDGEDGAAVAGPPISVRHHVVDQPRDVGRPVDFGHLAEHGCEQVVEDDLAVEADDEVVHAAAAGQVAQRSVRRGPSMQLVPSR